SLQILLPATRQHMRVHWTMTLRVQPKGHPSILQLFGASCSTDPPECLYVPNPFVRVLVVFIAVFGFL
ncbi:MAG: hypothetical protein ACI84R_003831, partial [Candidatus Azotimanducaceae bacterium]